MRAMISFIIPAYNEERLLGATLDAQHAAARAVGEDYELIVVDDASTDATALIAERHGARLVRVEHRQIAATRNSGARVAQGELLIFVDADTLVNEAAVRSAVAALRNGAAGGGAAVSFDGTVPFYARLLLPVFVRLFRFARLAAGCFLFCGRGAFAASGGFDEQLFCTEELAMSQALKRHGRFVVLRESVTTSGRKLRTYSGRELLRMLGAMAMRGPGAVKQRLGMDIWYGERREDPHSAAAPETSVKSMPA
jgi:glycosyltransferase involved in cell wall biosynthesis